jgi:hypothetical protein
MLARFSEACFNGAMRKTTAFVLLGPTVKDVAESIGVSGSAVRQWPDQLPRRIEDRVLAAWARKNMPEALRVQLEEADRAAVQQAAGELAHAA